MNDLVIHSKLAASVVDDQYANTATAIGKGVVESRPQPALINDRETLLDIARLSHSNHAAIIADIKHTVLLEDWTQHVLNNDGWRGVGDEAGLFVELLGEEIHTQVAVLARLRGSCDADDLARTALKD